MFDNCRKAGLRPPEFRLENGFFILTVWRKKASGKPESPTQSPTKSPTKSPTQSPTQSADPVSRVLTLLKNTDLSSSEIMIALELKHRPTFRENYLHPALERGFIEYTIPDKPNSRLQKYRLTKKGAEYLKKHGKQK